MKSRSELRVTTRRTDTTNPLADLAAPSYAPYPTTIPRPKPTGSDGAPWWSEKLLLESLGQMVLLQHFTQPTAVVQ